MINPTNEAYLELISDIVHEGSLAVCRGHETVEVLNHKTVIDMNYPLVTLTKRRLGYRFACAEAAWTICGENKVSLLEPYSKQIKNFSDDGIFFFGAYGPKIVDQLEYIGRCFKNDLYSRQAVINIWREKPPVSKDIPCTLNMQFIIRKNSGDNNILHTIVNMRSSDLWLGVPYDWFNFSMISTYVALYLRKILNVEIYLGELTINAGSRHYYKNSFGYNEEQLLNLLNDKDYDEDFQYRPIWISEFKEPFFLYEQLLSLAEKKVGYEQMSFLEELEIFWRNK